MTDEPNALPRPTLLTRGTVTIGGRTYDAIRDGREGAVYYWDEHGRRNVAQRPETRATFEPRGES